MMQQKDKLESFKISQNPLDSLHAKYSSSTGATVVTVSIDDTSYYLSLRMNGILILFYLGFWLGSFTNWCHLFVFIDSISDDCIRFDLLL